MEFHGFAKVCGLCACPLRLCLLDMGVAQICAQGAHIVDEHDSKETRRSSGPDPRDIRLPNHNSAFSHMAIDVSSTSRPVSLLAHPPR